VPRRQSEEVLEIRGLKRRHDEHHFHFPRTTPKV
jgi:hypothetical protein